MEEIKIETCLVYALAFLSIVNQLSKNTYQKFLFLSPLFQPHLSSCPHLGQTKVKPILYFRKRFPQLFWKKKKKKESVKLYTVAIFLSVLSGSSYLLTLKTGGTRGERKLSRAYLFFLFFHFFVGQYYKQLVLKMSVGNSGRKTILTGHAIAEFRSTLFRELTLVNAAFFISRVRINLFSVTITIPFNVLKFVWQRDKPNDMNFNYRPKKSFCCTFSIYECLILCLIQVKLLQNF